LINIKTLAIYARVFVILKKMARKKFNLKNEADKLKKKIAATAKKVGVLAQDAPLLPILPLILVMKGMLKKRGIKVPSTNMGIVKSFHENIVKKHKTFDDSRSNLVDDIVSIVKDIIGFFAKAEKKKKEGKATPEELEAVAGATKVAETPVDTKKDHTMLIVGGLAVVVIAFVVLRKK